MAGIAPRWPWLANISPKAFADVDDVDVGGVDLGRLERAVDDLGGQGGEVAALAGEVAGEIALVAAEDPDVRAAHAPDAYYN